LSIITHNAKATKTKTVSISSLTIFDTLCFILIGFRAAEQILKAQSSFPMY
jgi:uncharacterized membrane protein YcaP (DUF421 family)